MSSKNIESLIFVLCLILAPHLSWTQTELKNNNSLHSDFFRKPSETYGGLHFPKSRWAIFGGMNSYTLSSVNYYKLNVFGTNLLKKARAPVLNSGEFNALVGLSYTPNKGRLKYSLGFETTRFSSSEGYNTSIHSTNSDTLRYQIQREVDYDVIAFPLSVYYEFRYEDSPYFFFVKAGIYPYTLREEIGDTEEFIFNDFENINITLPYTIDTIINPNQMKLIRKSTMPYRQLFYLNLSALAGFGLDIKLTKFTRINIFLDAIIPISFLSYRHTKITENAVDLWENHYYSPHEGVQFFQTNFGLKLDINLGLFHYEYRKDLFR